ncbi:hypothetical protein EV122DRAFT_251803 [Schizophyllum commune]
MSNSFANPPAPTSPEYAEAVQSVLRGSNPTENALRDQHENDTDDNRSFASAVRGRTAHSKRGSKRPRQSSSQSPVGNQSTQSHSLFHDRVPLDVPGPESMEVDSQPPAPQAGSSDGSTTQMGTTHSSESREDASSTVPSNVPPRATSAPQVAPSAQGASPGSTSDNPRGVPLQGDASATHTHTGAAAQHANAQPAGAPPTAASAHGQDTAAPPPQAQAPPHAQGTAHIPAPNAEPTLQPGDRYSPFAYDFRFAGLAPAPMLITYVGGRLRPVFRPSPTQVTVNTTDQCIMGFNNVTTPKFLVWVQDVGHRNDATGTIAELRDHVKGVVPGGLADNVRIAPFHALDTVNPTYPMPYYFFVTNVSQAVVDVMVDTHRFNCDDGYTFYSCSYDATIRGQRYMGAFQWNLAPEDEATVVSAFTDCVLTHPSVEAHIGQHNDAVPATSRTSLGSIKNFLASTVEASPIRKGNRVIWRVYMHTPTHNADAFDKLIDTIHSLEIPTTFNGVGRYYKIYPCRMCRSLDHSTDSCEGPVLDTIPGWRRLATTTAPNVNSGHGQHPAQPPAALPIPSIPSSTHINSNGASRGSYTGNRNNRGEGSRHAVQATHPYQDGRPFRGGRGGGRGGNRGGRGGRGGYFDKTYSTYT